MKNWINLTKHKKEKVKNYRKLGKYETKVDKWRKLIKNNEKILKMMQKLTLIMKKNHRKWDKNSANMN